MNTGAKRLSYVYGGGETSFLSISWGRNSSLNDGANLCTVLFSRLNPHDASKYLFADLKNDLIFNAVSNDNFHATVLIITISYFSFSTHFKASSSRSTTSRVYIARAIAACSG